MEGENPSWIIDNVIPSGACAINGDVDIALFGNVPEHSFAHRRATDITQADDEDFV
jgi:hypothetical protein